jgi:uncharacterized membrane protein YdjX (TVP38/TMEM64 family)
VSRPNRATRPPGWGRRTLPRQARPLLVLAALVVVGLLLEWLGLLDRRAALDWARGQQAGWLMAMAIIAVQIVMFAFALPGMPHSVISYASGLLHLALPGFLAAAALGFAVKGFLYSSAIVGLLETEDVADLLDAATLVPLIAIALLLLVGRAAKRRWRRSRH